jgi:hypothetical protein
MNYSNCLALNKYFKDFIYIYIYIYIYIMSIKLSENIFRRQQICNELINIIEIDSEKQNKVM